ncbi:MAG: TIGR03936 family radical SAM-associated protein [Candidatus Omnitrophota bacterium]|jgi:radical SAM-linked protein
MYTFSFVFTKTKAMKYISHLDLMRLFTRAFRRAGFALKMTQGFSPHPKFSIKRALKLGLESENELASVSLRERLDTRDFQERLQKQMPEGITIKQVYEEVKSKFSD